MQTIVSLDHKKIFAVEKEETGQEGVLGGYELNELTQKS